MPLLWLSIAFFAGLVLGNFVPWAGWGYCSAGVVLAWAALWILNRFRPARWLGAVTRRMAFLKFPPILLAAALAAGAWRISAALPLHETDIARLNGTGKYQITGMISEPPDERDTTTLITLDVEQASRIDSGGTPGEPFAVSGRLLVMQPIRADWRYGDRILIEGSPEAPPGAGENSAFSYRDILARRGIASTISYARLSDLAEGAGSPVLAAIYALRQRAYEVVYALFPPPEAPLLAGILLGIDSDLPPGLMGAFQATGTAHIIAISGFNIAILAGVFSQMFNRLFSRWWAGLLAALAVAGYAVLTGASPSVVRAAIMGGLGIGAALFGRRMSGWAGLNALAITAALMCLGSPFLPWDVSFQLSFCATLGLMLYGGPLQAWFGRFAAAVLPAAAAGRAGTWVGEYVLMTLAAQLATLPVMLYHFHRLSSSMLLANPLVLPAQPLVMILSGLAVVTGLVWVPLGRPVAWLALPLSTYTIRVVEWLAAAGGGNTMLQPLPPLAAILMFAAILLLGLAWNGFAQLPALLKGWLKPGILLVLMGLAAAFLVRLVFFLPDRNLHLVLFDQDGAPVLLLETPRGGRYLIDAGPSANRLSAGVGERLSPVDHRLDGIIITDCRADSLRALEAAAERFAVGGAWAACEPEGRAEAALIETLANSGSGLTRLSEGQQLVLDGEIEVEVAAVEDDGAALLITWRKFRALLAGSVDVERLAAAGMQAPGVLVVPGERLNEAGADGYLSLQPGTAAVTSANSLGGELPAGWLRTGRWGWVEFITDGERMRAETSEP